MTACQTGCTLRDQHLAQCRGDCWGCLPRPTDSGLVCARCQTRLGAAIRTTPALVDWLRQQLDPTQTASDRVSGTHAPPAPLNVAAVADADDLHAMLASWALLHLEEHPDNLSGPRLGGTLRTTTGDVAGVLSAAGNAPTVELCRWLNTHLPWALDREWAGVYVSEVTERVAVLRARYPDDERSRAILDVPCPRCDRLSLVYHPPAWAGSRIQVICEHYECGAEIPEDRWGLFIRLAILARSAS